GRRDVEEIVRRAFARFAPIEQDFGGVRTTAVDNGSHARVSPRHHTWSQCDQTVRVPAEERQFDELKTSNHVAKRGAFPFEVTHGRGNGDSFGRRARLETDIDRCREPDAEVYVGYG